MIVYAKETKAFAMLRALMTTHGDMGLFEETDLAPYTCRRDSSSTSTMHHHVSVDVASDDDVPPTKLFTCIDIVGSMDDDLVAKEILNIRPIRVLIQAYYKQHLYISAFHFIWHIIYMSSFGGDTMSLFFNDSNTTVGSVYSPEFTGSYLYIFWPVMIMLFNLYLIYDKVNSFCRQRVNINTSNMLNCRLTRDWSFFSILFSASVIAWFIAMSLSSDAEVYLLVVALLLGWTYTIYLGTFYSFVHVMLHMFFTSLFVVVMFLYFYAFILLGFAFAMHALFCITQDVAKNFPNPAYSLFYCFNILVGMADWIYDSDFDKSYKDAGGGSGVVKVLYVFYVIIAAIILINMLIAWMTVVTSAEAVGNRYRMWEVSLLRYALQVSVELSLC